jgi:hypothetical protein
MSGLHHVRITVPDARGILARIELDGEELRGVSAVSLDFDVDHNAVLTLKLYADLVIEGEAEITKVWRQGLPWWRRLPYWLHAR